MIKLFFLLPMKESCCMWKWDVEVTCHKQSRPRQQPALGSREDHRALIFHKHFVYFIFYARKTRFCATSFFLAELLFNSESRPPGWTDSQDWESSRLLNSTSFLTHNLGGEVVDLVDLEHLHFLLLHFLCLTSFLLQLLGRWHCQLSLQKLAIEGWKRRRHPFFTQTCALVLSGSRAGHVYSYSGDSA